MSALTSGPVAPLDDPQYVPQHPPVQGIVPDVVARWGAPSQLRWFNRFRTVLAPGQDYSHLYSMSAHHPGDCCGSCFDEGNEGYGVLYDDWCCCQDTRHRT